MPGCIHSALSELPGRGSLPRTVMAFKKVDPCLLLPVTPVDIAGKAADTLNDIFGMNEKWRRNESNAADELVRMSISAGKECLIGQPADLCDKVFDLAHDAILIRQPDDRIQSWNRGARDHYGWTAKRAVGKVSSELLHMVFPEPLEAIVTSLQERKEWEGELKQTSR